MLGSPTGRPQGNGPKITLPGLLHWPSRCTPHIERGRTCRMPKQIGYAVVGASESTRHALLPAFASGEKFRLSAVVATDRAQTQTLTQEFRAPAYHLDEFRQCLNRDDVQAVYIALPNSLHSDYTVDAARAGMHILCERPMAVTADECRRMIRTCQTNRVKLMVSYRLQFHPAFVKALDLVRMGQLGILKTLSSDVTLRIPNPDDARLQRRLGGGSVYEAG